MKPYRCPILQRYDLITIDPSVRMCHLLTANSCCVICWRPIGRNLLDTFSNSVSWLSAVAMLIVTENFNFWNYISFYHIYKKCQVAVPSSQYIRKHVLPRLFAAMDSKRDQVIDFEEYVCAVALFRIGSTEAKIKSEEKQVPSCRLFSALFVHQHLIYIARRLTVLTILTDILRTLCLLSFAIVLFLMYEPVKGTHLAR